MSTFNQYLMNFGPFFIIFRIEKNAPLPIDKIHIDGLLVSSVFLKRWIRRFGSEMLSDSSLIKTFKILLYFLIHCVEYLNCT
jgi:hypothetical protein